MSVILRKLINTYHYVANDLSDPRSRDNFFILNPLLMILVLTIYFKFVTSWGPKFMEKRKPFKIENIMIFYNLFQILISVHLAIVSVREAYWSGYYSLVCQPIIMDDTPKERIVLYYIRMYYLIKIVDLMDTVFFILRKKYKQVSFLHVYHHMMMVSVGFLTLKYVPGGHGVLLGTVNTFVHTVMYTYYFLTSFSSDKKKNIWWKKYITQLQIVQFLILLIHFTHVLFRPSCTYPKWISLAFLPQNAFMLYMFVDFYIKEYIKKKK